MKKRTFKRISAAFAACTVMASAMPVTSVMTASAAGNLISNSDFENGIADWGMYKESGGKATLAAEDGKLAIHISDVGKVNYAVQAYYDIIPLYKNGVYKFKYDIYSTEDRYIEAMIQQNGGTYQSYTWKGLELISEPQTIEYTFTMKEESDIMAKLCFNLGIQTKHEGEMPEHTVYIDNVSLELVDDSNVNYDEMKEYEAPINVNQVGYRTNAEKKAVIRGEGAADEFEIINVETKESVYKGKLSAPVENKTAEETNRIADFSDFNKPGKYCIKCGTLDNSYPFEISDSVYSSLLDDTVKMLYLQRCGVEVNDSEFGHKACHTDMATLYGTSDKIDVSGGWHDAGDYGRYVVPGAKTIADLFYAYDTNPQLFGDATGIPESGNKTPDILDEARFELEWMLKMQDSDGGVHHKVSCATFPGYVMPTAEVGELIVTPVSSTATADFCAAMAMASEYFKEFDKDFAAKCLAAAEKSWAYLEAHPEFNFKNPADIVTGDYGDLSDKDERYWAAAQMFRATGDEKYSKALEGMKTSQGLDWTTVGDYGNIAILTMDGIDKESTIYKNAKEAVISQADDHVASTAKNAYDVTLSEFNWGSNMTIANAGMILGTAYNLTGDSKYLNCAESQLNYLLGVNPLAKCFVSGYGTDSPKNPHHRPSMAVGKAMKGMLAGGVNQNLEDSAAKAYCKYSPSAKCYVDNSESYSTNEITIYWNSPLTCLLSLTEATKKTTPEDTTTTTTTGTTTSSTTTSTTAATTSTTIGTDPDIVFGDANCDGKINMGDTVLIMQSIANQPKYGLDGSDPSHITAKGYKNADAYDYGSGVTNADALSVQKYLLDLIDTLPEAASAE